MTDIKINGLSAASSLTDSMQLEVDTGGTTSEKITLLQLAGYQANRLISRATFVSGKAVTLTDLPSTENFLLGVASNARFIFDLSVAYSQVRMTCYYSTAGSSGSYISLRYATTDTVTFSSYNSIGTSAVTISIDGTAGIYQTSWIDLASGAKVSPCYCAYSWGGGNGTSDPVITVLAAEFR